MESAIKTTRVRIFFDLNSAPAIFRSTTNVSKYFADKPVIKFSTARMVNIFLATNSVEKKNPNSSQQKAGKKQNKIYSTHRTSSIAKDFR